MRSHACFECQMITAPKSVEFTVNGQGAFWVSTVRLMILGAGIMVGNQLWNNPPHDAALAEAGSEKAQSAIGTPRPMRQATKRD
jgi:hypothetical protein